MTLTKLGLIASVSSLTLTAGVNVVMAQESEPSAEGLQGHIEEVLVTARKRAETLYEVPVSVTVVSADRINSLGANSLDDLNSITPNVTVAENGAINIRGIQSNVRNVGFEAGISIFIDGVYLGRPALNNQDLLDVDQIEVLRGPQGTLYGKNTTAGAINITTLRPTDQLQMRALAEYGDHGRMRGGVVVAGPIVDGLVGGKLTAYGGESDGYVTNRYNGQKTGNDDYYGFRGELRLTPTAALDIALRADWLNNDGEAARVTSSLTPGSNGIYFGAIGPGTLGPIDIQESVAGNTPTSINEDAVAINEAKGGGVSLSADYQFEGGSTLTSITAYRTQRTFVRGDDDYTTADLIWHTWDDRTDQWTQELRLSSRSGERFRYVIGAYALHQKSTSARPITLGTNFPLNALLGTSTFEFRNDVMVKTTAYSLFANADYDLLDKLTLNVGLRYTDESKKLNFAQLGVPGLYPDLDLADEFADNDLSPTVSLIYRPVANMSFYGTVSRGFKSGGWNPDITSTDQIQFNSESVTNYEIGTHMNLLDGRLALNAAVYHMDYDDLQISQFLSLALGRVIRNAGAVKIDGAEFDLTVRPASWLTLSTGAGYNDAVFTDYDDHAGGVYTGNQVQGSPKWSVFAAGDVRYPLGFGDLIARAEYSYRSRVYFTPNQDADFSTEPEGLVNARVGLSLMDGRMEVLAFGENLTDEVSLRDAFDQGVGVPVFLRAYSEGRRFGVRVTYRYR